MATAREVYDKSTDALNTLSNIWQSMLQILQDVSAATASSLTVEPDLLKLQKARKDYEQLLNSLGSTLEWLQLNQLNEEELGLETDIYKAKLKEQAQLQQVCMFTRTQTLYSPYLR